MPVPRTFAASNTSSLPVKVLMVISSIKKPLSNWSCWLIPVCFRQLRALLMLAIVEELLARDLVLLVYCVDADFFAGDALAGGFRGDVEGEVDDELIRVGAVKERASHGLSVEGFVGDPVLGFLDHRSLSR